MRSPTKGRYTALAILLAAIGATFAIGAAFAADSTEVTISQKDKEFSKSEVTIKPGDTIVFDNDDTVAHNVFCNHKDCKFNTKIQATGTKSPIKFENEGEFEVRCAIHPKMKLTVTVKK